MQSASPAPRAGFQRQFGQEHARALSPAVLVEGLTPESRPHRNNGVRRVTRLGALPGLSAPAPREEIRASIDRFVSQAMAEQKRGRLECLMLDAPLHPTACGDVIWERLIELLEDGSVLGLGVSVRSPAEALAAMERGDLHYLELPFNLLDWRWEHAGVTALLKSHPGIAVAARDPYLRGLLVSPPWGWPTLCGMRPEHVLSSLAEAARDLHRESIADLCLSFVRGQDWIGAVELPVESDGMEDALRLSLCPPLNADECDEVMRRLPRVPEELLCPSARAISAPR